MWGPLKEPGGPLPCPLPAVTVVGGVPGDTPRPHSAFPFLHALLTSQFQQSPPPGTKPCPHPAPKQPPSFPVPSRWSQHWGHQCPTPAAHGQFGGTLPSIPGARLAPAFWGPCCSGRGWSRLLPPHSLLAPYSLPAFSLLAPTACSRWRWSLNPLDLGTAKDPDPEAPIPNRSR